uniref:Pseudouridine synthase RsuA/RluA-like domain-containing protein n=1 Tax=Rhodosorus marinus TaxID=101924 RepID=A0A7S3EEX3_9RHOD|mmetsp:Transcript_28175/g.110711  ORF Transcript_28175/g.110711 Transcript_28175/m.110711 type:complete len:276 (+) Transcript_28175:246-1073(+)|eukprot:CAMPEP_0113968720 /NCGR_PEP_ID=MMETSP0011_2-20120614/9728_1 /TAXON_ID=101924 /ORGANISM="Rhodosorus marinus" /LENGTH=275 /DNA_ID=CAMNT_0000981917 /DNA_START=146 /DNA_END=973 /DNA_ORIENTATION=- /assembly_acc=CAM_ASM_000156
MATREVYVAQAPRKKEGDEVTTRGRKPPRSPEIDVIYEDEGYVVVNKPADVRMDGEFDVTVEKLVRAHLTKKDATWEKEGKIRFVHQLDYATSGVLLLALTRRSAAFTCKQFERRTVQKKYLALVYGTIPPGTYKYDENIANQPGIDFRMTVGTSANPGRSALTYCTPVGYGEYLGKRVTKVLLEPSSGRRHQLRVHLLTAGFPIVGDATYALDSELGPDDPNTPPRMFLHAWNLLIVLPAPIGLRLFETDDPFKDFVKLSPTPPAKIPALVSHT